MTNSDPRNLDQAASKQRDDPGRGVPQPEKTLRPGAAGGHDRVAGSGKGGRQNDDLLQDDSDSEDADALSGDQPDDPVTGEPRMREVERKRDADEDAEEPKD